jgi:hypothetical protein
VKKQESSLLWGILGGGFGLYGYLPALVNTNQLRVLIHKKNQPFLESRSDLTKYIPYVEFVGRLDDIFTADSLVFSVLPGIQEEIVRQLGSDKKYKKIVLEKPLSLSPSSSDDVLEKAIALADSVRVGYSFVDSYWGNLVREKNILKMPGEYQINWMFLAHHFRLNPSSWKIRHDMGGGVLRFYGIQLLAYLASIGEADVEYSKVFNDKNQNATRWHASFKIINGARVIVCLDTNSRVECFDFYSLEGESKFKFNVPSPFFFEKAEETQDKRISVLEKVLESLDLNNAPYYGFYRRVNKLWSDLEKVTVWEVCD